VPRRGAVVTQLTLRDIGELFDVRANRLLNSLMTPIDARVRRLFRLTSERDPTRLCAEHRDLHDAIRAGDADLAAALAFVHVERGRRPSLDSLASILPADRP
jgi:DNA-binding GntR family transcriptional regulator